MLQVIIEQSSVNSVADYIERTKQRIFAKMREGMQEAMEVVLFGLMTVTDLGIALYKACS